MNLPTDSEETYATKHEFVPPRQKTNVQRCHRNVPVVSAGNSKKARERVDPSQVIDIKHRKRVFKNSEKNVIIMSIGEQSVTSASIGQRNTRRAREKSDVM